MLIKNWGAVWALLVLIALPVIGFVFFDGPHCLTDKYACGQEYNKSAINNNFPSLFHLVGDWMTSERVSALSAIASVIVAIAIAIFTRFLAVQTSGLQVETARMREIVDQQRADMLRSIIATEETANAAKISAQAAMGVELPKLLVVSMTLREQESLTGHPLEYPIEIDIVLTNFGRTPAFLRWRCIDYFIGGALPSEPDYSKRGYDLNPILPVKTESPYTIQFTVPEELSDETKGDISETRKILWVYGYIVYRDFLDNDHTLGFCASLSFAYLRIPALRNGRPKFILGDGPAAYTNSL